VLLFCFEEREDVLTIFIEAVRQCVCASGGSQVMLCNILTYWLLLQGEEQRKKEHMTASQWLL